LFENGYVKGNNPANLNLDSFQIISPYNAGYYGTLGLNDLIRREYKQDVWPDRKHMNTLFGHSEKIIRIKNWYRREPPDWKRTLVLSNGSIGVLCDNKEGRYYYFPEKDARFKSIDDDENFEPAYAITVHKSQGSEFRHVFVVIPARRGLLYRELVYTALTRSQYKVSLFYQYNQTDDPLDIARQRSATLSRNTSLFISPQEAKSIYEPETDVKVDSKIEYIIYRALMAHREKGELNFDFHQMLKLSPLTWEHEVDFTVYVGDRQYFWEHLGMLDRYDYYHKWQEVKNAYKSDGYSNNLVTTDDLYGLSQEIIEEVIQDLLSGAVKGQKNAFSQHHYELYR
jgi:hypothetical protein